MARPQNGKRRRDDEPSQADIDPPAKRAKTKSEIEREAWESWEYPPEFYDRLSKVSLSRRALKELDRRTHTRRCHPSPPVIRPRDLAQFARHGGPDLRHLRGVSRRERSLRIVFLTSDSSIPTRQLIIHVPSP